MPTSTQRVEVSASLPIADNAKALEIPRSELLHLRAYCSQSWRISTGIFRVFQTKIAAGDLLFDRQAVAIPAGPRRARLPSMDLITDDDVLQNFVQGVANVDVAIGTSVGHREG